MISKGARFNIEELSYADLMKKASDAPNIYRIPSIMSYRIVTINGCNCIPCTGTHVKNIKEIGSFSLKDIEKVPLGFRIYFEC